MKEPSFQEEKKLWRRGFKRVACLDEAGRGPLAGPVVAAAVTINKRFDLKNIRDSKKLSAKQREYFYEILTHHPAVKWGIGKSSEKTIDRINILEATKLAMKKAVLNLDRKLIEVSPPSIEAKPHGVDFLILDGKMAINLPISQKSIVKADEKVFSCAAASILAKVTRDRLMMRCHRKYPRYKFNLHKGYPTKLHRQLLKKYGPCPIHRKSFGPVRSCQTR